MENPVMYRSKTEVVEEYLRRKILQGEIRSGQRLLQDAVAREVVAALRAGLSPKKG